MYDIDANDERYFGSNVWVYCNQHMRPHLTGWCTVHNRNKTKLDASVVGDAYEECRVRGFDLYGETENTND
jgi:hypothetical protein